MVEFPTFFLPWMISGASEWMAFPRDRFYACDSSRNSQSQGKSLYSMLGESFSLFLCTLLWLK